MSAHLTPSILLQRLSPCMQSWQETTFCAILWVYIYTYSVGYFVFTWQYNSLVFLNRLLFFWLQKVINMTRPTTRWPGELRSKQRHEYGDSTLPSVAPALNLEGKISLTLSEELQVVNKTAAHHLPHKHRHLSADLLSYCHGGFVNC